MIDIGVIGYGYWGPNIARNLDALESAHLIAIADTSAYGPTLSSQKPHLRMANISSSKSPLPAMWPKQTS